MGRFSRISFIAAAATCAMFLLSCTGGGDASRPPLSGDPSDGSGGSSLILGETLLDVRPGVHDAQRFSMADWSNEGAFNATWRPENILFEPDGGGTLSLRLDVDPAPRMRTRQPRLGEAIPYASGEYRSVAFYGYGRYETSMRAARGAGLVSSFFVYTGPADGRPWDEIDIEILGKDPTRMQVNYWTDGQGGKETHVELGFDASAGFHDFAFEWHPDFIKWYVNGLLVHTETGARGPLPSHAGRIMMNLWPGIDVDSWLEPFDPAPLPVRAQHRRIRFTPFVQN